MTRKPCEAGQGEQTNRTARFLAHSLRSTTQEKARMWKQGYAVRRPSADSYALHSMDAQGKAWDLADGRTLGVLTRLLLSGGPRISSHGTQDPSRKHQKKQIRHWMLPSHKDVLPPHQGDAWSHASSTTQKLCHLLPSCCFEG